MKTMSKKFLTFTGATILALGLGACGAATDQVSEERPMLPGTANDAMDEAALSAAFDSSVTTDIVTITSSFSGSKVAPGPGTSPLLITCTLRVDNPHNSTHVPGAVNVVATALCSSAVSSINMLVGMALNGVEITRSSFGNSGSAFLQGNAAAPCVSGTYQGAAAATVTFPPGYVPSTSTMNANSARLPIGC